MKINATTLVKAITSVLPGIDEKAPLVDFKDVILTGNSLLTYNDRIGIAAHVTQEFEFDVAVNCTNFLKSAKSFKDNTEINIFVENNQLVMSCNDTLVHLAISGVDKHSVMEMRDVLVNPPPLQPCPKDFVEALKWCQFSLSRYSTFRVLACVSIDGSIANSSDDLRVSEYTMQEEFQCPPFLLFYSSVAMLTAFDIISYSYTDGWIFFGCSDDTYIYCQLIKDDFPNPDELFEVEGPSFVLPVEMKTAIEACTYLADDSINGYLFLTITIEKGQIIVKGGQAKGKIKKVIPYPEYKGEKISFTSQPSFLIDVLDKTAKMTVGKTSALFEAGPFRHVISLKVD